MTGNSHTSPCSSADDDRIKRAVRSGWDAMADGYQAETIISTNDVHYGPLCPGERELGLMGDVQGKSVLELACGSAQNSVALAKWGALVTALDISSRQIRHASALVRKERVGVRLVRGDGGRLAMFRDAAFDLVVSSFGWEFIPDLEACFQECHRVLSPAGRLVVCTVHPLAAFEWDEELSALPVTDYFHPPVEVWEDLPETRDGRGVTFFRTIEETATSLNEAGFVIERIVEPYPYPLEEMTLEQRQAIAYGGRFWEEQYERLRRVPFSIVYVAQRQ